MVKVTAGLASAFAVLGLVTSCSEDPSNELSATVDASVGTGSHDRAKGDTATEDTSTVGVQTTRQQSLASPGTESNAGVSTNSVATDRNPRSSAGESSPLSAMSDSVDASVSADVDAERDAATFEPDAGDANDVATVESMHTALCAYYQRCAPTLFTYYGAEEGCLTTQAIYAAAMSSTSIDGATPIPGWSASCVQAIASMPCAEVDGRVTDDFDQLQFASQTFGACGPDVEGWGCTDVAQCNEGFVCSAQPGQCGQCTRRAPTDPCGSMLDCETGEACLEDECVARKVPGSECDSATECVGLRCNGGTCAEPAPVGTSCDDMNDCDPNLWCKDGTCASPGTNEAACDELQAYTCQAHLGCAEATCRPLGATNVPVGGLCVASANCVAGAACRQSLCVATENECAADNHCAASEYCDDDCLPRQSAEQACSKDWQCQSDLCVDGECLDPNACHQTPPADSTSIITPPADSTSIITPPIITPAVAPPSATE